SMSVKGLPPTPSLTPDWLTLPEVTIKRLVPRLRTLAATYSLSPRDRHHGDRCRRPDYDAEGSQARAQFMWRSATAVEMIASSRVTVLYHRGIGCPGALA